MPSNFRGLKIFIRFFASALSFFDATIKARRRFLRSVMNLMLKATSFFIDMITMMLKIIEGGATLNSENLVLDTKEKKICPYSDY